MNVWFHHVRNWCHEARLSEFSSQKLASNLGISQRQLQRYFKGHRIRLQDWLDEIRLQDSRHLLDGHHSIKEVAFLLYYKQQSHFTRQFKRRFGMTPNAFSRVQFLRNPQFEALYTKLQASKTAILAPDVAYR